MFLQACIVLAAALKYISYPKGNASLPDATLLDLYAHIKFDYS